VTEQWIVGLVSHPNDNEIFLGKNKFEEVQRMDEAMSLALQPLDRCMVNYVDDSNSLRSTRFVWGASDAFGRAYKYRKYEKPTKQRLEKMMRELRSLNKRKAKMMRELCSLNERTAKKNTRRIRLQQNKSNHEAKRKEIESHENKKYASESAKRTKIKESALALLSSTEG
jgi:hypothetical protein